MILEFVNQVLIVLLVCLEIFAMAMVIRNLERRRSTVMPGYIRDFDDTPSLKRRQLDNETIQYLTIISGVAGGIVMSVSFMVSSNLFGLILSTGIVFVVFSTICKILLQKALKRKVLKH